MGVSVEFQLGVVDSFPLGVVKLNSGVDQLGVVKLNPGVVQFDGALVVGFMAEVVAFETSSESLK